MPVVVVAVLRAAMVALRDARQDAADASPAETVAWLDAPVEQRDGPDARQDDRDARRGDPAGCRVPEGLAGQAERPGGQAARLHRDDRDVCPEDACRADPDERRAGDPGHPDAMRREAA